MAPRFYNRVNAGHQLVVHGQAYSRFAFITSAVRSKAMGNGDHFAANKAGAGMAAGRMLAFLCKASRSTT